MQGADIGGAIHSVFTLAHASNAIRISEHFRVVTPNVRRAVGGTVNQRHLKRNRKFVDSPQEGSGFELLVSRCALIANSATLVGPLDSAVSGGSLNGRLILQPRSVGGPATARLTPAARSELAVPKRLSPHCQINFS
jgi:hypothetical protein